MTAEQIGILSAIVVITKIFASPTWGWLADHLGKRVKMIQIASLFSFLSFCFVFISSEFWPLFIVLFVFSIFWSAGLPLIEATTLSHLGEHSSDYTVIRIWGSVSFIVCVFVLGYVFDKIAIDYLLPILLLLMVLVWLESLTIPEVAMESHADDDKPFMSVLKRPSVIFLFLVCFLLQASHGSYYTFFSIYLKEFDYSNSFIGLAWSLGVIAEVIVYLFIHRAIKQCGLRLLMIISLMLASLRWVLIALFVESIAILMIAQCLHAASFGVYHAVAIQYIHREFKGSHQSKGQALYSSISFGAGMAAGTLLSGYLWDVIGSSETFLIAACLSLFGLALALYGLSD